MNGQSRWTRSKDCQQSRRRSNGSPVDRKKGSRRPLPRPHETEEEAIIRRFHDAQRMARFRAKKKKAMEEARALEASKLSEIAMITELRRRNVIFHITNPAVANKSNDTLRANQMKQETQVASVPAVSGQTKYSQLLSVIEELGKDIRLTYAGSRSSVERLKMGISQARTLVRDCLLETEANSRQ